MWKLEQGHELEQPLKLWKSLRDTSFQCATFAKHPDPALVLGTICLAPLCKCVLKSAELPLRQEAPFSIKLPTTSTTWQTQEQSSCAGDLLNAGPQTFWGRRRSGGPL